MTINGKFTFGYAYDITTGGIAPYSNGSHELMIKAIFGEIKQKRPHRAKKRKNRMSRLERLEQRLNDLDQNEKDLGAQPDKTEDGEMNNYDDQKEDKTKEVDNKEPEKTLQQRLVEVEQEDRELRAKVRALRDEAESQGYSSPNDPGFPKRSDYLDALDQIKEVYRQKKELDALLD